MQLKNNSQTTNSTFGSSNAASKSSSSVGSEHRKAAKKALEIATRMVGEDLRSANITVKDK